MRTIRTVLALIAAAGVGVACRATIPAATAQPGPASATPSDAERLPEGSWLHRTPLGRVWVRGETPPYAGDGQWVLTDRGWAWVADGPWPSLHAGRFVLTPVHDWIWSPDSQRAQDWVDWTSGEGGFGVPPPPPMPPRGAPPLHAETPYEDLPPARLPR
jgi:hypothetical protein